MKNKTRARRSRTAENIAAIAESIEENPGVSIPRRSLEVGIPQTGFHRILHKDLVGVFADWVVEMHDNDPEFHGKIILSDEAHFHLGGFVNKQNFRICGSEYPRVIVEKPLYHQRVTVWCGLWPKLDSIDLDNV